MLSHDELERIREQTDLREIYPHELIKHHYSNRPWLSALCQFHSDENPSMRVGKDGFRCMAASCDVHGDVFFYVQLAEGVDFPTAVRILQEKTALTPYIAPPKARTQIVRPPDFSWAEVHRFTKTMSEADYHYLEVDRLIPRWAVESLSIGTIPLVETERSGLFTIPIVTDTPETIRDVKIYNPQKQHGRSKFYHLKSGAGTHLAFLAYIPEEETEVYLMAGEHDYAVAFADALPVATSTGGEGIWKPEWTHDLERFRHIFVVYDNDEAGWIGASKILKEIPSAHRVNFGLLCNGAPKDYADFKKAGYSLDDFEWLRKESLRRYG